MDCCRSFRFHCAEPRVSQQNVLECAPRTASRQTSISVTVSIPDLLSRTRIATAAGEDWVDYDDEDDADDTYAASWKRELVEVSPGTSPAGYGTGRPGGYGGAGSPLPYGSPPGGISSPPPVGILSPPPPPPPKVIA